jgi:hypothetical protein
MSTVHCNTVQTSSGGPVTLTKQAAAKVIFSMNLNSGTYMDITSGGISSECLNISSGTDAGTGLPRGNLTNAMNNKQYIWTESCWASNNLQNLDVTTSTTSLISFQQHDADSSNDIDALGCSTIFGDLA